MAANKKPIVLAVDDSILMQDLIKSILTQDYEVLVASNAIDALAILNHEPVSVLLLDVSMPEVNGHDLCRIVRTLPKLAHLPIIMLTARDTLLDKVQGRISGATEYLTKPFDKEQLCQVVGKLVGASFLEKTSSSQPELQKNQAPLID